MFQLKTSGLLGRIFGDISADIELVSPTTPQPKIFYKATLLHVSHAFAHFIPLGEATDTPLKKTVGKVISFLESDLTRNVRIIAFCEGLKAMQKAIPDNAEFDDQIQLSERELFLLDDNFTQLNVLSVNLRHSHLAKEMKDYLPKLERLADKMAILTEEFLANPHQEPQQDMSLMDGTGLFHS